MTRPVRALLVNENIGGHATVHLHLRRVAAERSDVVVDVEDVPSPHLLRRALGAPVPLLARRDADLRAARYQLAQSAWVARALPQWMERGYDVVHLYTHNTGLLARRSLRDVPYVVTLDSTNAQSGVLHPVREPTRFSPWSSALTRPLERRLFEGAARVVANSAWAAQSLRRDYSVSQERLLVLPMGVPVVVDPPEQPSSEPPHLPTLVFVGRSMARKGGYLVLAAHQRHLLGTCRLVLVTQDPSVPEHLPDVTVLRDVRPGDGRIDEILAGATVLALPSAIDQWPNAVMEAMAHGVVPVVSAVGGMPEMVGATSGPDGTGAAGIVLGELTELALARAVADLLADPVRTAALRAAALERVRTLFDVRLTANRLLDEIVAVAR